MIILSNPFFWHDAAEIIFFAAMFYYFSVWLAKDTQKNLLGYFYSYLLVVLASHHAHLETMHTFLVITAPIAIVLFIITHQEILQRNFVALRNIIPASRNEHNGEWLEALMRSFLVAASENKELTCVIENFDALEEFITSQQELNIPIKKNVLDLIFESTVFDSTQLLWTNAQGTIRGINATWLAPEQTHWMQHALFITSKTDAIIFNVSATTRTFTIIACGNTYTNITAMHALSTIKKYLHGTHKGDALYAQSIKKNTQQQSAH